MSDKQPSKSSNNCPKDIKTQPLFGRFSVKWLVNLKAEKHNIKKIFAIELADFGLEEQFFPESQKIEFRKTILNSCSDANKIVKDKAINVGNKQQIK